VVLHGEFLVRLGVSEEEVSKVVTGKGAVKIKTALGLTEQILDLLVERPS